MQLSEARFITIDGTSVSASVNSAAEAKIAIKEIRQKKREYTHIKRGLLRQKKEVERLTGAPKGKKTRKPKASEQGFFSRVASTVTTVAEMAGAYGTASAKMDLPRIEEECARADEILHNLDTVLIQIEGKLLRFT
jgi:hypothetical protein